MSAFKANVIVDDARKRAVVVAGYSWISLFGKDDSGTGVGIAVFN